MLVKTLLEAKQPVPEFLKRYIPEGFTGENAKLDFEDESDGEDADQATNNGDTTTAKPELGADLTATNGNHVDDWGMIKDATTQVDDWGNNKEDTTENAKVDDWGVGTPAQRATTPEKPKASETQEEVWVTATMDTGKTKRNARADDSRGAGSTTAQKPATAPNWAIADDDRGQSTSKKSPVVGDDWGLPRKAPVRDNRVAW